MSKHTNYFHSAVFVSVGVLLGACGGGGGGGGGGGNVTASSAPVTISAANAEEVAAAAYKTTSGLEGGGSGAIGLPVLTGAVTQTAAADIDLFDVLMSRVEMVPELASANAAASLTGVVVSETVDCFSGGSMSITLDVADNNQQLSAGDSMSFNANNCIEDGMVMNGSVTMNIVNVSGDLASAPHSMQLSMQANNFTITEGAESFALNGGMTLSESTNDGVLFTHAISGNSIQVTEGGVSASLTNFSIEATEDNNTLAYTLDLNATVDSAELGGSVTIVTDIVFEGSMDFDYPSSGQATITGANNSRVTLIAMGPDNVRLEIDEDGNGTAETFIDTTWGAL